MPVGVTVGAMRECDLEPRVRPFRNVALSAFEFRMLALQWIGSSGMVLQTELGGFPAIDRVARPALPAISTLRKLSVVRVGSVAVHACLERKQPLKVSTAVALHTAHIGVFSCQWEFGF
jgi:hypothetical protein